MNAYLFHLKSHDRYNHNCLSVIGLKHRLNQAKPTLNQATFVCKFGGHVAGIVHFAGRGARRDRQVVPLAWWKDPTS